MTISTALIATRNALVIGVKEIYSVLLEQGFNPKKAETILRWALMNNHMIDGE